MFHIRSDRALPGQNSTARRSDTFACEREGVQRSRVKGAAERLRGTTSPLEEHQSLMPAISLASCFLPWMLPWRAIMMRWAWGEPAPCMDSVR